MIFIPFGNAIDKTQFKDYHMQRKEADTMKKVITINGMSCNHCKAAVEKALSSIDGVSSASVNLAKKSAVVALGHEVPDQILLDAVKNAGYEPVSVQVKRGLFGK